MFKKLGLGIICVSILILSSCSFVSNTKVVTDDDTIINQVNTSVTEIVQKVEGACVGVISYDDMNDGYSLGSGVIISQSGSTYYAITNCHVVKSDTYTSATGKTVMCKNVYVLVGSRYNQLKATVLSYDDDKDMAVVSFESLSTQPTVLDIKNSDPVIQAGETCIAIGCPLSVSYFNTVTVGVVSNSPYLASTDKSSEYVIQHDAAINPGNSGGGLFNLNGELIGLNFEKRTYASSDSSVLVEGIGFAIALCELKTFLSNAKVI